MNLELSADQARRVFDPQSLDIDTTEECKPLQGIIGQKRAVSALQFGLGIEGSGFNIYVAGSPGFGKMTAVEAFLADFATRKPVPPDLCYVTNFEDPYRPQMLALPPGTGRALQSAVKTLVERVRREIPKAFESDDYMSRRDAIQNQLEVGRQQLMEEVSAKAHQAGFKLEAGSFGIALIPMVKGRALKEEEFQLLPETQRQEFETNREQVQRDLGEAMKQIRERDRAAQQATEKLDEQIVAYIVGGLVQDLSEHFSGLPEVTGFLAALQRDICENIAVFKPRPADGSTQEPAPPDDTPGPATGDLAFRKYQVNVIVDNGKQTGAPVVVELNPSYTNLFGRIEKETHFGALYTDLTMIKAGTVERANGGYLVLPAEELVRNRYSWDALKGTLRAGEIQIEELAERMGQFTTKSLRPEPVPLDLKVILVGSAGLYYGLYDDDEDFAQFFKVKADFDTSMDWTDDNVKDLVSFLGTVCRKENLKHLDRSGIAHLIEHAARLAEDQEKLSTHFGLLADVIREAHFWAEQQGAEHISGEHVHKALDEKVYRSNLYQERISELISRHTLLINTTGHHVGQVNGLSVISAGDYEFGRPSRITASVGPGREGVLDIEREVRMGGPIHSKGVLILNGYLRHKYAPDQPLTLGARLVFEQSYEGVEGDSASSAELYALLSALSELPIKQGIAVTGSINQHGDVQAIGGVNAKIEGFYDVCHKQGLDGHQGVIIPESNVQDLMLRDDVVQAMRDAKFHIWGVETIDEGLEILTGVPAGERSAEGAYPPGTVNDCVTRRLADFVRSVKDLGSGNRAES